MDRNILQYIENPMGHGSAAMSGRRMILEDYAKRFAKLETRYDFTPVIYHDKSKDVYYFHFLIPSETENENTYDVIVKLSAGDENVKKQSTIGEYTMQLFSNSPSFVYTFAYAYNKEKLLIENIAKDKYDHAVLSKPPVLRNPQEVLSYEKSTTFAILYLTKDRKYLNKLIVDPIAIKYTEKKLLASIRNDEKIKVQIQREKNRVKKKAEELDKKRAIVSGKSKNKRRSSVKGPRKAIKSTAAGMKTSVSKPRKAIKSNVKR